MLWSRMNWLASSPPPSSSATVIAGKTITRLMTMRPTPRREAELARQFAATQQQRYATEQPPGANPFSPADYEFSPMKNVGQ